MALDPSLQQPTLNHSPFLFTEESKFLMHVFATQTVNTLFPAESDLFPQRLIGSALNTPHLLNAILASACSHHGRLLKDASSRRRATCLKYTNSAICSLREELSGTKQKPSAELVTTALILSTNDLCYGNIPIWRTHLRGVLRLLLALLEQQILLSTPINPFIECLAKWFKTMDVLAALSGLDVQCVHNPEDVLLGTSLLHSTDNVDDICGFSLDLFQLMAQVSRWTRRQYLYSSTGLVWSDPSVSGLELETKLYALLERSIPSTRVTNGHISVLELQSTHRAFTHAALLHLHRRVQMLPKNHIQVRTDLNNILDAVSQIHPFSLANILILWPVFTAGCETDIITERGMIQTRMGNMQSLGMGNFARARQLLHRFWSSETSLPWDAYFAQVGLELVLF
jgi:hypothetical protein